MTGRTARVAGSGVMAAVACVVALALHAFAGGAVPSPSFLLGIWVFSWLAAVPLVGRRAALWRTAVLVLVSQGAFHLAFEWLGMPSADAAVGSEPAASARMLPHAHDAAAQLAASMPDPVSGALQQPMEISAGMLLAHLAAAVITVIAIYRGERVVRWLLDQALRRLRLLQVSRTLAERVLPDFAAGRFVVGLSWLLDRHPHRGPPAFA